MEEGSFRDCHGSGEGDRDRDNCMYFVVNSSFVRAAKSILDG